MKKVAACLLLTLAFAAAFDPHARMRLTQGAQRLANRVQREEESTTGEAAPTFSEHLGGATHTDMLEVTLYFRFADTDVLGTQRAQLDIRREETVATSIVQRLVDGPDISHERLKGVFPQGTEVISVTGEGRTAFVTLNSAFLGKPDGAPPDWEDQTDWQEEAALRRRLAVQSIVLALTEDGSFQRVQMYIADGDDDFPQRIPLVWMEPDISDPTLVLAACARDEQALLTPGRAMTLILDAWQAQDWAALYPLLADTRADPLPALTVFEAEMAELGVSLLQYSATEGTVSFDGQTATLVVDAQIRTRDGGDAEIVRESVPLTRVRDNWTIARQTLRALMVRD